MQRIFSAEDDFGFLLDDATDNLAAWDAMWSTLQPGDKVTFGAGVLRTSGTLVITVPGVELEGVGSVYWPYDTLGESLVWGTVVEPCPSFTGSHLIYLPPSTSNGNVAVNNVRIQGMVVHGNSLQVDDADVNGITMECDVRAVELLDVTVTQTSGHGILSLSHASGTPRGGVFDHITVWSAGNLAGTTQWGICLEGFTDAKFNAISVIDCRGGGIHLGAPGQITGTHIHGVFNHGVGIHLAGMSGNGGLNWSTIVTDRNVKEGVLIEAHGRPRILLSNLELRRDGGNEEDDATKGAVSPNTYAGGRADLTSSELIDVTGYLQSDEGLIPAGAKGTVLLRCAGEGGDGIVSPAVQIVAMHAW